MLDTGWFCRASVDARPDHVAAKSGANRLVSQAHGPTPAAAGKVFNQIYADAQLLRRAWTRRDIRCGRDAWLPLPPRATWSISADLHFLTQLSQILHQVVGKGIVVVRGRIPGWLVPPISYFIREQIGRSAKSASSAETRWIIRNNLRYSTSTTTIPLPTTWCSICGELGQKVEVRRNDQVAPAEWKPCVPTTSLSLRRPCNAAESWHQHRSD